MKLYRLSYSPYARKVEMVLDLLGRAYVPIDMPYSDRSELAQVTGGYIYVPVLVEDNGTVICDSRRICEHLLVGEAAARLVPAPLDGPIWAYSDWCDNLLEDVVFRIASPYLRDQWKSPGDRALFVLIKERKFGAGCVDAWARDRESLIARAQALLAPTVRTLAAQPFVFGGKPTLADAALYGEFALLAAAEASLPARFPAPIGAWMRRMDELAAAGRA